MGAQGILDFLANPLGVLLFVVVCAPITAIIVESALKSCVPWFATRDWWPRAAPLQKALMMNFGYPESACTDLTLRNGYAYVIILCTHHFICGLMMLPVVCYGWAGAGVGGQACLVVGALMDVSMDVYDEFKMFTTTFLFETIGKKLFGGEEAGPVKWFIVLGCLHHPLAMAMTSPMVLYYPHLASFHAIAISLLLAAGICFTTGSYKFTLDMTKASDWYQFKFIVILQTFTILYTRGYIWVVNVYAALATFRSDGSTGFFIGGCIAGAMMSLFNVVMILDSVTAFVKWMPRSMAEKGTPHHDLQEEELKNMTTASPVGSMMKAVSVMGLSPASTFRADVKVVVAAAKFKKGLKKNR